MKKSIVLKFLLVAGCAMWTASVARAESLADLIANNGTITQGDKLFSNFTYIPTGDMPDAGGVVVTGITSGLGNHGIRFSGGFADFQGGGPSDALITYDVTVLDPNFRITDAHLDANIDANSATGGGSITESFLPEPLPFLTVFDVNPGGGQVHDDYVWGLPGYTTLHVQKDILMLAQTGLVSLSLVDQTFSQTAVVPLPAAAWGGMALLGLLGVPKIKSFRRDQIAVV